MKSTEELMRRYCEESGELYQTVKVRPEISAYEEKIGKSFLEMKEYEIRDMFKTFVDHRSKGKKHIIAKNIINNIVGFYTRFFNWCIDKGYIKGTNIFLMESLSSREIHAMLYDAYKEEIPVLLEEKEFEKICKACRENFANAFYYEAILRLLYEGVIFRLTDLVDIKVVDTEKNTVLLHKRTVKVSKKLCCLLKEMQGENFVLANGTLEARKIDNSYFYFIVKKNREVGNIREILSRGFFKDFSRCCGLKITPDLLYYSGLYNFLLKKTGGDRELVYDMLYDGGHAINSVVGQLTEYAGEFGSSLTGKNIRNVITKYRI